MDGNVIATLGLALCAGLCGVGSAVGLYNTGSAAAGVLAEDNKKDYFKIKIVNDWLKKYYQAASIIKFSYQSKKTFEDDIDNKIKNFYNNTNQTESFFDFEHDA